MDSMDSEKKQPDAMEMETGGEVLPVGPQPGMAICSFGHAGWSGDSSEGHGDHGEINQFLNYSWLLVYNNHIDTQVHVHTNYTTCHTLGWISPCSPISCTSNCNAPVWKCL